MFRTLKLSHVACCLFIVVLMTVGVNHLSMFVKAEEKEIGTEGPVFKEIYSFPPGTIFLDTNFHEIEDETFEYEAKGNGFSVKLNTDIIGPLYRFTNGTLHYDLYLSTLETTSVVVNYEELFTTVQCDENDTGDLNGTKKVRTEINTTYYLTCNVHEPNGSIEVAGNKFIITDIYPGIDLIGEVGLFGFKDDYIIRDFSAGDKDYVISANIRYPSDSTFSGNGLNRGSDTILLKEPVMYDGSDNFNSQESLIHDFSPRSGFAMLGFSEETMTIEVPNDRIDRKYLPLHIDPISSPVTTSLYYRNETIVQNSNLTIADGGLLILDKCTLLMNSTTTDTYKIKVQSGGEFGIYNSTTVMAFNESLPYSFVYEHGSQGCINTSLIRDHGQDGHGLNVSSDDVYVYYSTIQNSSSSGILVYESCPGIETCWIHNNTDEGIVIGRATAPTIESCIIENNVIGIRFENNSWHQNMSYDLFDMMSGLVISDGKLQLGLVPVDGSYLNEDCDDHEEWSPSASNAANKYIYDFAQGAPYGQFVGYAASGNHLVNTYDPEVIDKQMTAEFLLKSDELPDKTDGGNNMGASWSMKNGQKMVNVFFKEGRVSHLKTGSTFETCDTELSTADSEFHLIRLCTNTTTEITKLFIDGELVTTFSGSFYGWGGGDGAMQFGPKANSCTGSTKSYWDWILLDKDEFLDDRATSGYAITDPISLPDNSKWGELILSKTENNLSLVKVSLLDDNSNPISGYQDLSSSKIDLSSLDHFTHSSIILRFDLENNSEGVYLEDFFITYAPCNYEAVAFSSSGDIATNTTGISVVNDVMSTKRTYSHATSDNPVCVYHMDENTGTSISEAWDGHDGTASGTSWVTGVYGSAQEFSSGDYISVSDHDDLDPLTQLTVEAWIYPTTFSGDGSSGGNTIISKWYSSPDGQFLLTTYNGGYLKLSISDGTTREMLISDAGILSTDQWYHVAATYNGSYMRLFVDGRMVAESSTSVSSLIDSEYTDDDLYIGSLRGLSQWTFIGTIDEVKMSYRTEDMTIPRYLHENRSVEQNQIMNLHLDQSSGTTATDETGYTTATVAGASWDTTGGLFNGALDLDGTGDYIWIDMNSSSMRDSDAEGTIEMWLLPDDNSASTQYLFHGSNNRNRRLYLNNSNIVAELYHHSTGYESLTADISNKEGWFHVAYHWCIDDGIAGSEAFRMDLYVDGHLKDTKRLDATTGVAKNNHYFIGRPGPGTYGNCYSGLLDDVQIYNVERRFNDCSGPYIDTTNTVGLFHFDRDGGTTAQNHGTGSNGSITNALWETGRYGPGLYFDGDGDYVNAGTMDLGNKGTIETWFKLDDSWTDDSDGIMTLVGGYSTDESYSIELNEFDDGALSFNFSGEYDEFILSTYQTFWKKEVWYHVSIVWDGYTYFLYVNGSLISMYSSQDEPSSMDWYIGQLGSSGNNDYQGFLDEVRFSSINRTGSLQMYEENARTIAINRSSWEDYEGVYLLSEESDTASISFAVENASGGVIEETTGSEVSLSTTEISIYINVSIELIGDVMASVSGLYVTYTDGVSSCTIRDNDIGISMGETDADVTSMSVTDCDYGVVTLNTTGSISGVTASTCDIAGVKSLYSYIDVASCNLSDNPIGFHGFCDASSISSTTFGDNDNGTLLENGSVSVISGTFTTNNHSIYSDNSEPRIENSDITGANRNDVYSVSGSFVSLLDCDYSEDAFQIDATSHIGEVWDVTVSPYDKPEWQDNTTPRNHWTFDEMHWVESKYMTYDSSVTDNSGEIEGLHPVNDLENGMVGDCFVFDGVDDWVDVGDIDFLDAPEHFTMAMWFRRDIDRDGVSRDTGHSINNVLISQGSSTDNDNFELGTEGSNIELYFDTSDKDGTLSQDIGIQDDTWYHLALTYNEDDTSAETKVYLNGEKVHTWGDWGGSVDSSGTSALSFGISRPDNQKAGDFSGAIDDVRIYDEALNSGQIAYLATNRDTDHYLQVFDESGNRTDIMHTEGDGTDSLTTYLTEKEFKGATVSWEYRTPYNFTVGNDNQFYAQIFDSSNFNVKLGGDSDGDWFDDANESTEEIHLFQAVDFVNSSKYYGGGAVQLSTDDSIFDDLFPINQTGYYKFMVRAKLINTSTTADLKLRALLDSSEISANTTFPVDDYWKWFQTQPFRVEELSGYLQLIAYDSTDNQAIAVDDILLIRSHEDGANPTSPTSVQMGQYSIPYLYDTDSDGVMDGIESTSTQLWYEAEYYPYTGHTDITTNISCENGKMIYAESPDTVFVEIESIPFDSGDSYEVWIRAMGTGSPAYEIWTNISELTSSDIEPTEHYEPEWDRLIFQASQSEYTLQIKRTAGTVYVDRIMIVKQDDMFSDDFYNNGVVDEDEDLTFDTDGENDDISIQFDWNDYVSSAYFEFDEATPTVHTLQNVSTDIAIGNRIDSYENYVVYDYSSDIYLYDITDEMTSNPLTIGYTDTTNTEAAIHGDFIAYIGYVTSGTVYSLNLYQISTGETTLLFESTTSISDLDIYGDYLVWQEGSYSIKFYDFNGDIDGDGTPNYKEGDEESWDITVASSASEFGHPRIWCNLVTYVEDTNQSTSELKGSYYSFSGDIEEDEQDDEGIDMHEMTFIDNEKIIRHEIDDGRIVFCRLDGSTYGTYVYDIMHQTLTSIGSSSMDPHPNIEGSKVIYRHNGRSSINVTDIVDGTEVSVTQSTSSATSLTIYNGQCLFKDGTNELSSILRQYSLEIDDLEIWNHTGIFTGAEKSINFAAYLNAYEDDTLGTREVPLFFKSDFHYTTSEETLDIEEFWMYKDNSTDPLCIDSDGDGMDDGEEYLEAWGCDIIEFEDAVEFKEWGHYMNTEESDEYSAKTETRFDAGAYFYQTGVNIRSSIHEEYDSGNEIIQDSYVSLLYEAPVTGTYSVEISPRNGPDMIKTAEVDIYGYRLVNEGNPIPVRLEDQAIYLTDDEEWYVEAVADSCTYVEISTSSGTTRTPLTSSQSCSLQAAELIYDPYDWEATRNLSAKVSYAFTCTYEWVEGIEYYIKVGVDLNKLPDHLDPDLKTTMGEYSSVPDDMNFEHVYALEIMDLDRAHMTRVGLDGMCRDTDGDEINDTIEAYLEWYPLNDDPDDDGIDDKTEIDTLGTDPGYRDSDFDGIRDGVELGYNSSVVGDDTSPGSWTERICHNGDPFDHTPINNYDSNASSTTDPLNPDTDNDGLCDGWRDGWSYRTNAYLESNDDFDSPLDDYGFVVRTMATKQIDSMGRFSYRYDERLWGYYGIADNLVQVYEGEDLNCDGNTATLSGWGFNTLTKEFDGSYGETDNKADDTDSDLMPDGWEVWYATREEYKDQTGNYLLNPNDNSDANNDIDEPTETNLANGIDGQQPEVVSNPDNVIMQYVNLTHPDGGYFQVAAFRLPVNLDGGSIPVFEIWSDGRTNQAYSSDRPFNMIYKTDNATNEGSVLYYAVPDEILTYDVLEELNGEIWIGLRYNEATFTWYKNDRSGAPPPPPPLNLSDTAMYDYGGGWQYMTTTPSPDYHYTNMSYTIVYNDFSNAGDGLTNLEEFIIGTHPKLKNSDVYDDLDDGEEVCGVLGTITTSTPRKIIFRTNVVNGSLSPLAYEDVTTNDWIHYDGDHDASWTGAFSAKNYSYVANKDSLPNDSKQILTLGYGSPIYLWSNTSGNDTILIPDLYSTGWYYEFINSSAGSLDMTSYNVSDNNGYWRNKQLYFSDPCHWDSDNDGINDDDELYWDKNNDSYTSGRELSELGYDPACNVYDPDSDNDGINDGSEPDWNEDQTGQGLDPDTDENMVDADADGDGVWDGWEVFGLADRDGDGLKGTCDADSDNDGLPDGWVDGKIWDPVVEWFVDYSSITRGTDMPASQTSDSFDPWEGEDEDRDGVLEGDTDLDGVMDEDETWNETNPWNEDSDEDGLWDGFDIVDSNDVWFCGELYNSNSTRNRTSTTNQSGYLESTNATDTDSDDDSLSDHIEAFGFYLTRYITRVTTSGINESLGYFVYSNPMNTDSDSDNITDYDEYHNSTNPNSNDTDEDGLDDWKELSRGINPRSFDSDGDFIPDAWTDGYWRFDVNDWRVDSDRIDGVKDPWEGEDLDGDGVWDEDEETDFNNSDTDDDGIKDGGEYFYRMDSPKWYLNDEGTRTILAPDRAARTYANSTLSGTWADPDDDDIPNALDTDSDNDGRDDGEESSDKDGWAGAWYGGTNTTDNIYYTEAWETLPYVYDSDGDGLNDGNDILSGGKLYWLGDIDGDGLCNGMDRDSDGDGLLDNSSTEQLFDYVNALDPNNVQSSLDTDQDGLLNILEDSNQNGSYESDVDYSDFNDVDTDDDGLNDSQEFGNGTSPKSDDTDFDGLTDYHELLTSGTNPIMPDSDRDCLLDGYDVNITSPSDSRIEFFDQFGIYKNSSTCPIKYYGEKSQHNGFDPTDALNDDSDSDGIEDGDEVIGDAPGTTTYFTDPTDSDTDGDYLQDRNEIVFDQTDPLDVDSDNDGLPDGWIDGWGYDETQTGHTQSISGWGCYFSTNGLPSMWEMESRYVVDNLDSTTSSTWNQNNIDVSDFATDPTSTDSDEDNVSESEEYHQGLEKNNWDTDGDGFDDSEDYYPAMKEVNLAVKILAIEASSNNYGTEAGDVDAPDWDVYVIDIDEQEQTSKLSWRSDEYCVYNSLVASFSFDHNEQYSGYKIRLWDSDSTDVYDEADITGGTGSELNIYYDHATGLWSDINPAMHEQYILPNEGCYVYNEKFVQDNFRYDAGLGVTSGYGGDNDQWATLYFEIYPCDPDSPDDYGDRDWDGLSQKAEWDFWGTDIIGVGSNDTDRDGIPDGYDCIHGLYMTGWESGTSKDIVIDDANLLADGEHGSFGDPDNDGISNLDEYKFRDYGLNPNRKDVAIEIDWYDDLYLNHYPFRTSYKMNSIVKYYSNIAFLEHDIGLHIDDGSENWGKDVFSYTGVNNEGGGSVYWDDSPGNFGDADETFYSYHHFTEGRDNVFHYAVFCHRLADKELGRAKPAFNGEDGGFEFWIPMGYLKGLSASDKEFTMDFMHELGHNFNLDHPIDNGNKQIGYQQRSCMYTGLYPCNTYSNHSQFGNASLAGVQYKNINEWEWISTHLWLSLNYDSNLKRASGRAQLCM